MPANDRAPAGYNIPGFVFEESNNQIRLDHAAVECFADRDPARLFHGYLAVSRRLDSAFGFAALSTDGQADETMSVIVLAGALVGVAGEPCRHRRHARYRAGTGRQPAAGGEQAAINTISPPRLPCLESAGSAADRTFAARQGR